jgi:hypothetical protein
MRRTLIESKRLYKNAVAVIALVAALAGAFAAVVKLFPKPEDPHDIHEIMEIVLDRSEGMGGGFEGGTKLQAAAESARNALDPLADNDVLALRQFGGPCDGDNTRMAVKPGQNNKRKIKDSLRSLAVGGQSTLVNAVIQATGDFDESERFKGVRKRIVVVTGSRDACSHRDPIASIRDRMERIKSAGIQLDFHFIGIGLGEAEREDVTRIADATGGVKPTFVDHRQDLDGALRKVLVVEPVVRDAQSVVTLLDAGVDHLNGVFAAIAKRDYPAAETELNEARNETAKSDAALDELGKGSRKEQFKELYKTAAESRSIRNELLDLAGRMLSQAKANDVEGYNASELKFNQLSNDYNRNGTLISTLLKHM